MKHPPPEQSPVLRRRVLILANRPVADSLAQALSPTPWRPEASFAPPGEPPSQETLGPPAAIIVEWQMPKARACLRQLGRSGTAIIAFAPAWPPRERAEAARQGVHGLLPLPPETARLTRLLDLLAGPEQL